MTPELVILLMYLSKDGIAQLYGDIDVSKYATQETIDLAAKLELVTKHKNSHKGYCQISLLGHIKVEAMFRAGVMATEKNERTFLR